MLVIEQIFYTKCKLSNKFYIENVNFFDNYQKTFNIFILILYEMLVIEQIFYRKCKLSNKFYIENVNFFDNYQIFILIQLS